MLLHVHMYRVVTTKYTFVPKNFIPINCLFLADSRKLFRTQYNNTTKKAWNQINILNHDENHKR